MTGEQLFAELTAISARASFGRWAYAYLGNADGSGLDWMKSSIKDASSRHPNSVLTGTFVAFGCWLVVFGFLLTIADRLAISAAKRLSNDLLPAFDTSEPAYNSPLIGYIGVVAFCASFYLLSVVISALSRRGIVFKISPALGSSIAAVGLLTTHVLVADIAFAAALVVVLLFWPAASAAEAAKWRWIARSRYVYAMLAAGSVFPILLAVTAYYPVRLPNDYYELAGQVSLRLAEPGLATSGPTGLTEAELSRCLSDADRPLGSPLRDRTALGKADVAPVRSDPFTTVGCSLAAPELAGANLGGLRPTAVRTGWWEAQAGRLLYHHSYIFVPAAHFLKYGFDRSVPYLYGRGNTLFHATLMAVSGAPSLTAYFNTYPIAIFLGISAIALLVFYQAQRLAIGITAFVLATTAFLSLDPEVARLAPGLSPLRFFGLVVQIASIFFVCRGRPGRWALILPLSLAFSLFWNAEFGVLGAAGQIFFVLLPLVRFSPLQRGVLFASCATLAGFGYLMATRWDGLSPVQLGIFEVAVPRLAGSNAAILTLVDLVALAYAWSNLKHFIPPERAARLATLLILALVQIKYLFFPAPPHLWFALTLIVPQFLIFTPWPRPTPDGRVEPRHAALATALVALALIQGWDYASKSRKFDRTFIAPFATSSWTDLGEQFETVVPEGPIKARVDAIRTVLKPNDQVLLLSPFDHLLAYFTNPSRFCGHFELLTNLVTETALQQTLDCARKSQSLLLVYDEELETGCPERGVDRYVDEPSCLSKYQLKASERRIMAALLPDVRLVGEGGGLFLYRSSNALAVSP